MVESSAATHSENDPLGLRANEKAFGT